MGEFVCSCGFSAKSKAGLVAHQRGCPESGVRLDHKRFTNRFAGGPDVCPRCSTTGRSFYKKDSETLVCLECGVHFTPYSVLEGIKGELVKIQWARPQRT